MDKFILYHDLKDALQHDSCPVCTLVARRVARAIKVILREGAGDGELIGSYVKAKGYCNAHAWQVKEAGDPSAQAVFYRALLEGHKQSLARYAERRRQSETTWKSTGLHRMMTLLRHAAGTGNLRTSDETMRFLDSFASDRRCPLCVTTESCERSYVESVVEYFEEDEEFRERYRNRGVMCHPHLRRLIDEHAHRSAVTALLDIQLSRLDLQIEQLREIEHTVNVRYSEQPSAAHAGGWIRAVRLDVGIPGTNTAYKRRPEVLRGGMLKP